MPGLQTQLIIDIARELGFVGVGFAPADFLEQDDLALTRWLAQGRHGGMSYMARDPYRRSRPQSVLPGARSVIVLATNYSPEIPRDSSGGRGRRTSTMGRVARYAWGRDYHDLIEDRLAQMEDFLRKAAGPGANFRSYVDHGPVLEKAFARQAGIGFIGKNTLLITEGFGSWVFLSVIMTTLDLESDSPRTSECGSCRACLDACPTGALIAPYQLDANRCISYLTIENKGEIPEDLASKLNGWVFGCDICQEVCPYNAHPMPTPVEDFRSEKGVGPWLDLEKVVDIKSDEEFRAVFKDTPLLRPKRAGLQRNAEALLNERE